MKPPGRPLRLLLIEDSEDDALLLTDHLRRFGYEVRCERVQDEAGLRLALGGGEWDAIICDYSLPRFGAVEALRLVQQSGRELPFLLITGSIKEETAIGLLKAGAHDVILKDNLVRLGSAIEREINEARIRAERAEALVEKEELYYKMAHAWKLASVGTLAAGVIHELNNPLTAVRGYAQLISESPAVPQPIRDQANIIVQAAERMKQIVGRLRALARLDKPSDWKEIDMRKPIEYSLVLLGPELARKGIQVNLSLAPDLPTIWGDDTQLESVFQNLLANSRDAFEECAVPEKAVSFTVERGAPNGVRIVYEDNGPGMPAEVLGKLFQSFFTTKDSERGTGLGMSIVRTIVERHGGTISVDSTPGKGTRFVLYFPERKANQVPVPRSPAVRLAHARGKPSILILDDEPAVAAVLALFLGDAYLTKVIVDPAAGLEEVRRVKYDGIITDCDMGSVSGASILFMAKEYQPRTPVLFMSGLGAQNPDIQLALRQGAAGFLEKPFLAPEQVRLAVQKCLSPG